MLRCILVTVEKEQWLVVRQHESTFKVKMNVLWLLVFHRSLAVYYDHNPYKPGVLFMGHRQQNSPRCDAAKRGVPFGAILFTYRTFIEN